MFNNVKFATCFSYK